MKCGHFEESLPMKSHCINYLIKLQIQQLDALANGYTIELESYPIYNNSEVRIRQDGWALQWSWQSMYKVEMSSAVYF